MTIQRLLYRSFATIPTDAGVISDILAKAAAANERHDLTGLLLVGDSWFLQVLEGPSEALDALLRNLVRDPRHSNIEVMMRRGISGRIFAEWAMASIRVTPKAAKDIEGAHYLSSIQPDEAVSAMFRLAHAGDVQRG